MPVKIKALNVLIFVITAFIFPETALAELTIDSITPSTITSADDPVTVSITAKNLSDVPQFLQAAMTKDGQGANYLGFTKNNNDEWVKYQSTPVSLSALYAFTPVSGLWSGQIQAKIDVGDSGFSGSGPYLIKVLKYISSPSSHQDSNSLSLNVNFVSPTPPDPSPSAPSSGVTTTSPEQPSNQPAISFAPPTNVPVGQTFTLPAQITDLPQGSYYLKVRLGPDANHLTKGQTYNNTWLSDNDPWTKFMTITPNSGSWQGSLDARLAEGQPNGSYRILIRLKKTTTDTTYESALKEITFTPGSVSLNSPSKSAGKKSPVATVPTANRALTLNTKMSSPEAELSETKISTAILGLATNTASTAKMTAEKTTLDEPLNLSLKSHREGKLNYQDALIPGGLFLLGFGGVYFLRTRAILIH